MVANNYKRFVHAMTLYLCIAGGLCSGFVQAENCTTQAVARVVSIQGTVALNQGTATLDDLVCPGDLIRVGPFSRAAIIMLATETIVRIDQDSVLRLPQPAQREQSLLDLLRGALYLFSREPPALDVYTPYLNAAVEGTEFLVRAEQDRSFITVFEGRILASNAQGQVPVGSNQTAVAQQGQAPRLIETIRPEDAVQWALYYQPVLAALYAPDFTPESLRRSLGELDYRNPAAVIERLDQMTPAARDDFYSVFRAAWLLAAGQSESAQTVLDAVLQKQSNNGNALALSAIIALTRNDKAQALALAQQAVEHTPQSAAAWLALSYAQQAQFDLDGALASTQTARERNPDNALVLARLSELWLSKGELDQALVAAQQAAEINPSIARTQSVLGFAYLSRIDLAQAQQAFQRAIELDQADPLPRLGLGLAEIRQGGLEPGREELAIAVSLDPQNSLLRSYLGKAYFEEKRPPLASTQYEIAKDLDPLDPTPWLYDALLKQAQNRPVEALQDIQKSIELNDNRAVYRSRLLLDEDEAVRGTSLGRIYDDLGFEQLALAEGAKSIAADPSNHSAYRFLSDAYAKLPRHEIARDSALLQAQLLQPININPVQPRLGADGVAFLDDVGLGSAGFNEFTPLFSRDQIKLYANGLIGSNKTFADNLIVSGIKDNFSYSLGQFHFETDGVRENNHLDQDIYNAFLQFSPAPETSLQLELRAVDEELGDRVFRFDPNSFFTDSGGKGETQSARLGFRHNFTPESTLLASYVRRESDSEFNSGVLTTLTDEESDFAELSYLYRWNKIDITSGFGYIDTDRNETINIPSLSVPFERSARFIHRNGYLYLLVNYPQNLAWTFGLSADVLDSTNVDRDQINPKFGLIWDITPTTTLRTAAFRTLKRTLISSQTLEPTQIAGFNQFFDDNNATKAWRYGIAVDQKIDVNSEIPGAELFVGIEFSKRDLTVPRVSFPSTGPQSIDFNEKEELGRIYWYWMSSNWLALTAEYQYERSVQHETNAKTHRIPLEARIFNPSGFFTSLRATYFNQKGNFANAMGVATTSEDEFWLMDAAVGYRTLEKGIIASFDIRNVFDERFSFLDTDPANSTINSERRFFLNIAFSF